MKRTSRIALVVGAASLLMGVLPLRADNQPAESVAMLARARKVEDLRADGGVPFVLRAQLKAIDGKRQVPGAYSLTWAAANRWHESLQLGNFSRVRDGVDGGYRQIRPGDYQPQVIFDLDQILDIAGVAQLRPEEAAGIARRRKIGGAALSCVEIRQKHFANRDLCFDPTSGLLVHAELECLGVGGTMHCPTIDYTGAVALGERRFPSQMRFQRADGFSIEVSVGSLEPFSGNADSLPVADPARSEFWGDCRGAIPAEATERGSPNYPDESKFLHQQGVVSLYARIETDGTVSHLKALRSPSPALERATLDAVKQWRYKPRTCAGTPVRDETVISAAFLLGF